MSFTNHTPNYNLPQYVGTDKPTFLGDFNNAMSAIDTALHNNEQNAGEGLSKLQQAQAALAETQETLTEVQTEVANVSGIASTVNQNVQQALTAANDATTAANSATSQIQPAVTAANQASADAQAAQQVANGNVATLNSLSDRVTALENNAVTEISGDFKFELTAGRLEASSSINAPDGKKFSKFTFQTNRQVPANCALRVESYYNSTWDEEALYNTSNQIPNVNTDIEVSINATATAVRLRATTSAGAAYNSTECPFTAEFASVESE